MNVYKALIDKKVWIGMVQRGLLYIVVLVVVIIIAILAYSVLEQQGNAVNPQVGVTPLAVQMTDPPNVPPGTQALVVTYSSVQVHVAGSNQSGWVNAQGNGTIDLLAVVNSSKTIAKTYVAQNSTINLVRFNITSAEVTINGTAYNTSIPNRQLTVAVTEAQKIGPGSSAVLIDISPTVNANGKSGYVLVPSARAIVINSNAGVSINLNVGGVVPISSAIRTMLGIGVSQGGAGNQNRNTTPGSGNGILVVAGPGNNVSNFMVRNISQVNGTVTGLIYVRYPVASSIGVPTTLHIGESVGYACDNTEARLTSINQNGTATFTMLLNTSRPGGCPI